MNRFERIGVPVCADETRSAAVCRNEAGEERVVIAARGYVVIVDPVQGECTQLAFPEGHIDYPFASMGSRSGLFYTGAGRMLMVLDPFEADWVRRFGEGLLPEEEIFGFAFAEAEDGSVYATTYPGCKLLRIDPALEECRVVSQLGQMEHYAMTLAVGPYGWIYAGVGTKRAGVSAYHPVTGTQQSLFSKESPVVGSGHVHLGTDGHVYASMPVDTSGGREGSESSCWYRLMAGQAEPVQAAEVFPSLYYGSGYQKLHGNLGNGRRIVSWQLAEGELRIEEPDGSETNLELIYSGSGAALSPIAAGPDGRLYGTSNHPLHLYRYDPKRRELINFGGKAVERGGGGNICAFAAQGPYLIGAAYAGGLVHLLDTRTQVGMDPERVRNPRLLFADARIHRPRCAVAHPDGEHVLYGGFPGYGAVGGALGVVRVPDGTVTVYEHDVVVPYQSTVGLAVLGSGDVIGATSIETPGGATPLADEAVLYRMDWSQRRVVQQWRPVQGARELSHIVSDDRGYVYGMTSDSVYFVFDPVSEKLLYRCDLADWGGIVRQGLVAVRHADTGASALFGLLSGALFRIDSVSLQPVLLARLPHTATSGLAYADGKLYYGCESELWSYDCEAGEEALA